MSDRPIPNELETRIARSLHAAAPTPGPDIADRVLRATGDVPQRGGWLRLRIVPVLAAAAVVVLAVAVGLGLGGMLGPDSTGTPDGSFAPSVTPAPSSSSRATPTVEPTPAPSGSPEQFPNGSRCDNGELGYSVSYPEDWHANEAVRPEDDALDPVPACQYFGEEPMEILPNAGLPPSVAISFDREADAPPPGGEVLRSEQVTVAGRPAELREIEGTGDDPFIGEGDRVYQYLIELPSGDVLIAGTDSTRSGDYEAHREVLDGMMATLELTER